MANHHREGIRLWQRVVEAAGNEELKIRGDVQALQEFVPAEADVDNLVVVTLREEGPGNIVSMNCINRFSDESWAMIDVEKPKHGQMAKLWLKHKSLMVKLRPFEFLVDENERLDIVLGRDAIKDLEKHWGSVDGYTRVIRSTKHPKGNVNPASLDLKIMDSAPDQHQDRPSHSAAATAAATEAAQSAAYQRDKEAEKERRKARRQASSSGSTDSVGSNRSQGSETTAN